MNLLFILPEYQPYPGGGIKTYYANLLPSLVNLGYKVDVIVGSPFIHGNIYKTIDGVHIRSLKKKSFEENLTRFRKFDISPELKKYLASVWAIYNQVNNIEEYDSLETTDIGLNYLPWIYSKTKLPVVTTLHGSQGQINYYDPVNLYGLISMSRKK